MLTTLVPSHSAWQGGHFELQQNVAMVGRVNVEDVHQVPSVQ